jgi:phage shock protein A
MATTLLDRLATLVRADAHGVLESLEERSLLLKQYVREAELELDRKRARLDALREEEKRLGEALARREAEVRALDDDIALALGGDKEELARFAIRRLLPRREDVKTLRAQAADRGGEREALAARVEEQAGRLAALKARVRVELARGAGAEEPGAWIAEPAVADEEVELELLRRREARGGGRS